jgi:hypothetical protein
VAFFWLMLAIVRKDYMLDNADAAGRAGEFEAAVAPSPTPASAPTPRQQPKICSQWLNVVLTRFGGFFICEGSLVPNWYVTGTKTVHQAIFCPSAPLTT